MAMEMLISGKFPRTVSISEKIMQMGNSGFVVKSSGGDGIHLHFEVCIKGKPVNPMEVLSGQFNKLPKL